jgi:1-aminocyclopropane-1-carboxylate deaminase
MQFKFISRDDYRQKDSLEFLKKLEDEFGSFYMLPEGGNK